MKSEDEIKERMNNTFKEIRKAGYNRRDKENMRGVIRVLGWVLDCEVLAEELVKKSKITEGNSYMTECVKDWHNLSEESKEDFNNRAREYNKMRESDRIRKIKSGYNLFLSECLHGKHNRCD